MSMFEIATRKKIRFNSPKGQLTCEQLWDVPLRGMTDFNLDVLARLANKEMQETSEVSFVDNKPEDSKAAVLASLRFDIIKHVIATKLEEEEQRKKRAENKAKKARLVELLAKREDEELEGLTKKQIMKQIYELED